MNCHRRLFTWLYAAGLYFFLFLIILPHPLAAKYDPKKDNPYVQSTKSGWFSRKPKSPYMNASNGYWKKEDENIVEQTLGAVGEVLDKLLPGK